MNEPLRLARVLGLSDEAVTALGRSALVHDFGTTGVPNSDWDKPGPLTRTEFDRVELHPMLTEHIYGKIGVSTRATAALWAMQHDVVQ